MTRPSPTVADASQGRELFNSTLDSIESQLDTQDQILARVLMDTIVNGKLTPREFFENTFYCFQNENKNLPDSIVNQLKYLKDNRFIESSEIKLKTTDHLENTTKSQKSSKINKPTHLGRAALTAGLQPEDAHFLYDELKYSEFNNLCLADRITVVFTVTL